MLAGIISFSQMTVTQNPDIDFPVVLVGVSQPGAAPAEMEKQVTQQIEAAVRGVNGVDEIDSSISEGHSQTIVQLQIGTPIDRAVNDVRNAVAQVRSNLPEGILEPTVQRIDTSGNPIVFVAAALTISAPPESIHRTSRPVYVRLREHRRTFELLPQGMPDHQT
jgi:multidrug efflux pump subunit AcrB